MRRALAEAVRGLGRVEPNPMVGAVVVREGRPVGVGHHARFGGPHAEVEALAQAGDAARGATLYVTLEPCCHFGKTPPCTEAVLAAGVARVVAAIRDPFPGGAGVGVDGAGRLPATGRLARPARAVPAWVAVTDRAPDERRAALTALGCEVLAFNGGGAVPILELLGAIGRRGVTNLLVEGGG